MSGKRSISQLSKGDSMNPRIKRLRLEAIFHPKFENENMNNQDIRKDMLKNVDDGDGYLEVTLKHSGSLLLWSGSKRYYSKNSTNNIFTSIGELLLRQHFLRAWTNDTTNHDSTINNESSPQSQLSKYQECSDYIEKNRLTLSFEVVTSVMGHHGDIPRRDYCLLLAVADRTNGRFYDTRDLLQFCQTWRLPHNDVWIYKSLQSCQELFHLYDSSREDGLAESVVATLNDSADGGHVLSMYPHVLFQGNILEGIVIRYVAYRDHRKTSTNEGDIFVDHQLFNLCQQSQEILREVPPEKEIIIPWNGSQSDEGDLVLCTDIRDLRRLHPNDDSFQSIVQDILHKFVRGTIEVKRNITRLASRKARKNKTGQELDESNMIKLDVPLMVSELLADRKAAEAILDTESLRIATLVQTLNELNIKVDYNIWLESCVQCHASSPMNTQRYVCIVHVMNDSSFQKYYKKTVHDEKPMLLYRGFSFEIELHSTDTIEGPNAICTTCNDEDEMSNVLNRQKGAKLMLKMKFLPYMVRTFICRNGLKILLTSGPDAFVQFALNLFEKWKMSQNAVNTWIPFIRGWSAYCVGDETKGATDDYGAKLSVPLGESNYLHFFNHFSEMFHSGKLSIISKEPASKFIGLAVVLGTKKDEMREIADAVGKELRCIDVLHDINLLTTMIMNSAVQPRGRGGVICAAEIEDGFKKLRSLAKDYRDQIHVVAIGCSTQEMETCYKEEEEERKKKIFGICKSWKHGRYGSFSEISRSDFFLDSSGHDHDTSPSEQFKESIVKVVDHLLDEGSASNGPDGPGLLVYFPSTPGSGKSTLSDGTTSDSLKIVDGRKVIIKVGDAVKKKYYPLLEREKSIYPSSVLIADKNAPPSAWRSIQNICLKAQSIPVAIVPDHIAVQTTRVQIGSKIHYFPFSLHYLAICIHRILKRRGGSHAGKLDAGSPTACMVVIKFFCLYHGLTAEQYLERLKFSSEVQSVVRIPFIAKDPPPNLPEDLERLMREAITLQMTIEESGVDEKNNVKSENMDACLRKSLQSHEEFIGSIIAEEATSKESFNEQLSSIISTLSTSSTCADLKNSTSEDLLKKGIKIVSIDVQLQDVVDVSMDIAKKDPEVASIMEKIGPVIGDADESNTEKNLSWVQNTHVTMMHCSESSQKMMYDTFKDLIGATVEIKVNGLLYREGIAALDVSIAPSTIEQNLSIPESTNSFTHITIWLGDGTSARDSNDLPGQVSEGTARKVDLDRALTVKGTVSFWPVDKESKGQ